MENRWWSAVTVSFLAGAVALSVATGPVGATAKKSATSTKTAAKKGGTSSGTGTNAKGKQLVESDCLGCHKIGTKGGQTGPELTHVGKQQKAANIAAKIKNPKAKNPNSIMPASRRPDSEINAMAAYLASLK